MFASKGTSALTGLHYVTHSLRVPSVRTLSGYKAKIHVDPKASPKPSNVTGLKSFLGLLQYYSKFLPNLSVVLAQLYRLLHRGCEWKWAEPEEEAFAEAETLLIASQLHAINYGPELPLVLACDASSYGIGAVLSSRLSDGSERPIAFASRTLSVAEQKYAQLEKSGIAWHAF